MPILAPSPRLHRPAAQRLLTASLLTFLTLSFQAQAQTSSSVYVAVQTVLPTTGLLAPAAVTNDILGDLYIADTGNNRVVEINTAGVQSTVLSGTVLSLALKAPNSVATDTAGNLYVSDSGNNRVLELSTTGVVTLIASGLSSPSGVSAAYINGTQPAVYIADTGNNRVLAVSAGVQSTWIASTDAPGGLVLSKPTGIFGTGGGLLTVVDTGNNRIISGSSYGNFYYENNLGSGLNKPKGVFNPGSSFYIADTGNNRALFESVTVDNSGTTTTVQIPVGIGLVAPAGLTVASPSNQNTITGDNDLYIADTGNNRIVHISHGSVSFGTINLGATSTTQTVTFSFTAPTTLNAKLPIQVLTQGAANLDFKTTGGTCAAKAYAAGASCTVILSFKPTLSGQRTGAVVLTGTSGSAVASVYLNGIGNGPQIAYDPGIQTTLATGLSDPRGIAVDGAGNVYAADYGNGQIVKVTPAGVQTNFAAISGPYSLSIDGAGNLYGVSAGNTYSPTYNPNFEISPSGVVGEAPSNGGNYIDLFVDAYGNLYELQSSELTSGFNGIFFDFTLGFTANAATIDSAGNLYFVDGGDWLVWKLTPAGIWSTIGSGYNRPQGIAVDSLGNVYVADFGNNQVVKVTPAGVQSTVGTGLIEPTAVTVDGAGNLYIDDFGNSRIVKINRSTPPTLVFASTPVGKTSSDSPQTVKLENIGTANLTFPPPTSGKNASTSTGFTLSSASTCPVLSPTSTAATLAPGSECAYLVGFTPTAKGAVSGSLVLVDNNLNVAKSVQKIVLSGTATASTAAVKLENLSQTFTGRPLPIAATSNPSGLKVGVTYNGKPTPPTAAGRYTVVGSINEAGYQGSTFGTLVIAKAVPVVAWAAPKAITVGTALGSKQLNAKSNLPGKYTYSPALGTKLTRGTHKLAVLFTPTATANYKATITTVELTVK